MQTIRPAILFFGVLAACSEGVSLKDGRTPTGSQALVTSTDFSALYVANANENTIAQVDLTDHTVASISVTGEPTRIARAGGRVIVSLRSARKLAVFEESSAELVQVGELDVGAEPYGVVAAEDGRFFYVASATSNLVEEFDPATLIKTRAWTVPGEPRWLAIHPSGETLYVGSAFGGGVNYIDLPTGRSGPIPFREMSELEEPRAPGSRTPRVTGDLAVAPNGSLLAIPALFVDRETPIGEDGASEPGGGYTNRINPAVVLVKLDDVGTPEDASAVVSMVSIGSTGYPSSVTFSPDSKIAVAAIEGVSSVAVFSTDVDFSGRDSTGDPGFGSGKPVQLVGTEAGPRGLAFTDASTLWVYGFLDRTVSQLDLSMVREEVLADQLSFDGFFDQGSRSTRVVVVATSNLPVEVERGRRLFYSAEDARVTQPASSISCATCHFEGRNDGITWTFDRGPRQTPSLAGGISVRAPFRWEGDRASIAVDALLTSQTLMGGVGLTTDDAEDIEAFVDSTRAADLPLKGASDDEIELGRSIFQRPEVGCAGCHSGAIYSDLQRYNLLGFNGVKTASLLGIGATAPYFHDGSAGTLREVLLRARTGAMGNTSTLSDAELSALERFLQTL